MTRKAAELLAAFIAGAYLGAVAGDALGYYRRETELENEAQEQEIDFNPLVGGVVQYDDATLEDLFYKRSPYRPVDPDAKWY